MSVMDIRQIKIALAVARRLSFSEAAWETAFSPSTVSKQVAALEEELGVQLFNRNARSRVTLTAEGSALLPDLQSLADSADRLVKHGCALANAKHQTLVLFSPDNLSALGEDELLAGFCAAHPEISVRQLMKRTSSQVLIERILAGEADGFFTLLGEKTEPPSAGPPSLAFVNWGTAYLNFALPSNFPAIHDGVVDLGSLTNETFIFRPLQKSNTGSGPQISHFIAACQEEGFNPKIRFVQMRQSAVFNIIAAGQGVAPLMHIPKTIYPGVVVVPCSKHYYSFSKVLYYQKDCPSAALKKLIAYLRRCKKSDSQADAFNTGPSDI